MAAAFPSEELLSMWSRSSYCIEGLANRMPDDKRVIPVDGTLTEKNKGKPNHVKCAYKLDALGPTDDCSRLFLSTSSPTSFFSWAFSLRRSLSSSDSLIAPTSSSSILIPRIGPRAAAVVRTTDGGAVAGEAKAAVGFG